MRLAKTARKTTAPIGRPTPLIGKKREGISNVLETIELTDVVLRVIGACYAFAGYVR
ncbi:MAG TPA: hypothetical protein VIG38_16290 [Hyphomicrobium sp.]